MVLDTNPLTRGQVARLDSHAHLLRLLKSRMPGVSELPFFRGLEETIKIALPITEYPLELAIYIDENKGNT